MPAPGFNAIVDISHHNSVTNWKSVEKDGIAAVIHKATEGSSYRDNRHGPAGKSKGAWDSLGFISFSSGANPLLRVENFLEHATPTEDELVCPDYEPSSSGTNMTYERLVEFVGSTRNSAGTR